MIVADNCSDGSRGDLKGPIRVVAYLGLDRPNSRIDYGEVLLKRLINSKHTIAGLIIHPSDPLANIARENSIPYLAVPSELLQSSDKIKEALLPGTRFSEFYNIWLEHVRSFRADIGVTVWSQWIPSELFTMPEFGFFNYHPAPLPKLRGMEPDTFAILDGLKEIWGTVHRVNHAFDSGEILFRTETIAISSYDTPVSVLENLNREGIEAVIKTLDAFGSGNVVECESQSAMEGTMATRKMAREMSYIDPVYDMCDLIERKLRAFCGQDIGIRLKIKHLGKFRDVIDLECHQGDFPGSPGDLLGLYPGSGCFSGEPVIRVADGVAVIRLGQVLVPLEYSSIFYSECPQQQLIPARKRRRCTDIRLLQKSIS